jgi:hypothetical protein
MLARWRRAPYHPVLEVVMKYTEQRIKMTEAVHAAILKQFRLRPRDWDWGEGECSRSFVNEAIRNGWSQEQLNSNVVSYLKDRVGLLPLAPA